ncbi:MAG: hypothetical protein JXA14_22980 [Anaerolineae bacterium]|nr:hypothetical protein [Anaerolineae bacterium]
MRRSYAERDVWRDDPAKRMRRIERMVNLVYRFMVGITGGVGDVEAFPGFDDVGTIKMWGRSIDEIPYGWALCDGDNGTPDLTNRFIVGAGGSYSPGDTGGADTVDLSHSHGYGTLATDSDSHSHDVTGTSGSESSHTHGDGSLAASSESSHTHGDGTYAAATGGTHGHTDGGTTEPCAHGTDHNVLQDIWVNNDTTGHTHAVTGTSGTGSSHTHTISGTTAAGSSHSHGDGTYATNSDSHSHAVTSGATGTGGTTTHDNRPQFYAVVFIMRIY